jgi:hypothetical protein
MMEEYMRCATDIEYFAEKYCTVWDKAKAKAIPFRVLPHQRVVLAAYKNHDYNIIRKYRQGGITTITCLYIAHCLNFTPSIKVAVIANQLSLARDSIFSQVINIIRDLPDWLRVGAGDKDSMTLTKFANNAQIMACAAAKNGIRGFSPDLAFLDEAAYLQFGDQFYTALMGSLSAGGKVILNSTSNGLDPLYWKTYDDAINGRNNYHVTDIFWYQDPRFNENLKWVRTEDGSEVIEDDPEKQKELIAQDYKPTNDWYLNICKGYNQDQRKISQEVDAQFLGSGGNMISEQVITKLEKDPINGVRPPMSRNIDQNGCLWTWEEPLEGFQYLIGGDISTGRSDDFQAVQVIKIADGYREQVAEYQVKLPPETMGDIIFDLATAYNNAYVVIDITGGYGISTMTRLLDLGYKNIHRSQINAKPLRDRMSRYIGGREQGDLVPGFNIGANREMVLVELETRLRLEEFIVHSSRLVSEFKTFVHNGQRYDHMRGSHDDLIFAAAMPLYAFAYSFGAAKKGASREKLMAMAKGWRQVNSQEREQMALNKDLPPRESLEKAKKINEKRKLRDTQDYFSGEQKQYRNPFQRF